MAKAKRIFQLAKELSVDSKAIVAKCQAEGVPNINNHMSTVSIGLEMTIRDWFSETQSATSIETTHKVDLQKARKARRRAKPKKAEEAPTEESAGETTEQEAQPATSVGVIESEPPAEQVDETAETTAETTSEAPPTETQTTAPDAPAVIPEAADESEAAAEAAPEHPEKETEPAPAVAASAEEQTEQPQPEGAEEGGEDESDETGSEEDADGNAVPNVPRRPDVIAPAGPQLKTPKAAKLKGPKVVRIEQPDVLRAPRSRRGSGGPAAVPSEPEMIRSRGPERGRGVASKNTEEDVGRSPRRKRGGGGGGGRRGRAGDEGWSRKGKFSEQDIIEREERLSRAGGFLRQRRRTMKKRAESGGPATSPLQDGGKVAISEPITIKDLSAATGIKAADIIAYMFNRGVMATINQIIGGPMAQEICAEYDIELEVKEAQTAEQAVEAEIDKREAVDIQRRPPVVTVLGHVDHGKTSLLDRIRLAEVAEGEAGGITQHIGAYRVSIPGSEGDQKTVVFLDTPGHEAFTNMRSRGANLTDLVVLVVAADDGVMPQTIESINHSKAAGVPIVVALNKIDKPEATDGNIQRILGQLAEHELNPVEWGGQTEVIRVSAETGEGINDLIEILDYQAELLELKADYGGTAYGQVIEAELSEGRGPVARVLVREGQLHIGDFIVAGRAFGRVRDMIDDRGKNTEIAGPATPIEVSGLDEVPDAGDKFYVTGSLRQAEQIAEQRREQERKQDLAAKTKVTLDNLFDQMKAGDVHELRVVVKADVQGSVEVLRKTLEDIGAERQDVAVRVLHAAVGGITESDVLLAEASDAIIIGFQVIASQRARSEAERRGVDIRLYRVIYNVVDDITQALEGMLSPERREEVVGHAEVRDVFRVTRVGMVAGCYVTDGVVRRNALVRVTRDGVVIEHDRTLQSLKRFKEDVREVRAGMECGMSIEGYDDIHPGDVLECYVTTEVKQKL